MLSEAKIVATVATSDVEASKAFYGGTLGLPTLMASNQGYGVLLPDGSALLVYHRPGHRPPENTTLTFFVPDVDATVGDLRTAGVRFEDYDMPGLRTVDGIAVDEEGRKGAWFKDPDGNIVGIGTTPTM